MVRGFVLCSCVLSRGAAEVYMRRWELLLSPQKLSAVLPYVMRGAGRPPGPEDFLDKLLRERRLEVEGNVRGGHDCID